MSKSIRTIQLADAAGRTHVCRVLSVDRRLREHPVRIEEFSLVLRTGRRDLPQGLYRLACKDPGAPGNVPALLFVPSVSTDRSPQMQAVLCQILDGAPLIPPLSPGSV